MNNIYWNNPIHPALENDKEFMFLKQPISDQSFNALKESILSKGCENPILIWRNYIVDGSKRYEICTTNRIPFKHVSSPFQIREQAYSYICRQQLNRLDLIYEMRKYLIGRLYQAEIQIKIFENMSSNDELSSESSKGYRKLDIASRIAQFLKISTGTVLKYDVFSKCIDDIREKEPDISRRILSGRLKISHNNIIELSRLPAKDLRIIHTNISDSRIEHITYSDIRHELQWRSIGNVAQQKRDSQKNKDIPIRQMPKYDPDSELSTLIYTIPTWVSSINRSRTNTDFSKASSAAKRKAASQLELLKTAIIDMEQSLKEDSNNAGFTTICSESVFRANTD